MAVRRALLSLAIAAAGFGFASSAAPQPRSSGQNPWSHCCGMGPWPQGHGMMGSGGHGMMGQGNVGMARNRAAMMGGVPAPYTSLTNPLPKTRATVERGAKVYAANCASCHGATGLGDGPGARGLNPPPANLAWLSRMPMANWDPFMFWTIEEGGAPSGTAMPAFKDALSQDDAWAAVAYIQARLPAVATK